MDVGNPDAAQEEVSLVDADFLHAASREGVVIEGFDAASPARFF